MHLPKIPQAGDRIGPFKLLEKVGGGGMGMVFLAEQERPIRRRVALKLIKAGMDTKEVIARFESERQALALMNHPSIARVFDAGATPEGRPFFAMEYVKGVPLTKYCDTHRLGLEERLDLFLQICDGVQHAHHKGVIHRDLKPSNVLVTIQEDRPVPKIIDFGVAKATEFRLTERTVFTEHGLLIGTPEYMSPEQAEMSGLDIDTRTDVYSLGVMLYELLSGSLPFSSQELRESGFDEFRRKVREEDPERLSTRTSRIGEATELAAKNRGMSPRDMVRRLHGDLDWITLKAMEKDRTRRYASPLDLATDIQRHLNHEPVSASPPNTPYRIKKFVRRHRVGVTAGGLVALAVLLGSVGTTVGLIRARQAERVASEEAETARQVSDFLVGLFKSPNPWDARGDTLRAMEVLDRGAREVEAKLQDQPLVLARLMTAMGEAYDGLGALNQALAYQEKALAIYEQQLDPDDPLLATGMMNLAGALAAARRGEGDDAETFKELLDRAYAIRSKILPEDHIDIARTLHMYGEYYRETGNLAESERHFREALVILESEDHEELDSREWRRLTVSTCQGFGATLALQGKLDEAEERVRRAIEVQDKEDRGRLAIAYHTLAYVLRNQGKYADAIENYNKALALKKALLPADHPVLAFDLNGAAIAYEKMGDLDSARAYARRAYAIREKSYGAGSSMTARSRMSLASLSAKQGDFEEAIPLFRGTVDVLEKTGEIFPDGYVRLIDFAGLLRDGGRHEDARWAYERLIGLMESGDNPYPDQMVRTLRDFAELERGLGQHAKADGLEARANDLEAEGQSD